MNGFAAIAPGIGVRRCPVLDVNSVLVVGGRRALLVDTLSCPSQARPLAEAVRTVTSLPVLVANTHAHFDHVFGNATIAETLGAEQFWAHRNTVNALRDGRDTVNRDAWRVCRRLAPGIAEEVLRTRVLPPDRPVDDSVDLDLGGRRVRLWHPGPAHTSGDLVGIVDGVFLAGDLVEEGAVPDTDGSDVDGWITALNRLLPLMTGPVVPGHGAVVDRGFVAAQAAAMRV